MWDRKCDLGDENSFFTFLQMLALDQSMASGHGKIRFFVVSEAATRDIIRLQKGAADASLLTKLHFLQFEAARAPASMAVNAGELHTAHNWILNAFSDDVSDEVERTFYCERVMDFFYSNSRWIAAHRISSLMDWFGIFYYYCSTRDALFEVAEYLQVWAFLTVRSPEVIDRQYFWSLCALTAWCCRYEQPAAPDMAAMLEELIIPGDLPRRFQADMALVLNGPASQFSSKGARGWAEWILQNVPDQLTSHQLLNVLISTAESSDECLSILPKVLEACSRTHNDLYVSRRTRVNALMVIDQRSDTLSPYAYKFHRFALRSEFMEIMCRWYGAPSGNCIVDGVLVILPNHSEGMAYLWDHPIFFRDERRPSAINDITTLTNETLEIALTLQGARTKLSPPARKGQPNYAHGHAFEKQLADFYCLNDLKNEELSEPAAIVSFPAYPHPVQALMRSRLGWTAPISSSLERPATDRSIQQVAIWYAGDDFYSKMEADAISTVFKSACIKCTKFSGAEASASMFQAVYENPDFDVVWISGHGLYDHWDPSSHMLQVGEHIRLDAEEVSGWNTPGGNRRLLVLNVCDGGVAAVLGGIHKLGMAPMITSARQATVSHLWPVEPRVASAFGVLLAGNLALGMTFFESYCQTLDQIRASWRTTADHVTSVAPGELADRINNCEHDMSNILNWGSPMFFG